MKRLFASALSLILFGSVAVAQFSSGGSTLGSRFGFSPPSGPQAPAWVASTCPTVGGAQPNYCIDNVNNRVWDGIAGVSTTPSAGMSITNATPAVYSPSTCPLASIPCVASISANTLGLGASGLQVFGGVTNLILQSNALNTAPWTKTSSGGSNPVATNPSCGGGVPCAPDGSNPWQIAFSAVPTSGSSQLYQTITTVAGHFYTCSIYAIAPSGTTPATIMTLAQATSPYYPGNSSVVIAPSTTQWTRYQGSFVALTTSTSLTFGPNTTYMSPMPAATLYVADPQCVDNGAGGGTNPGPYVATTSSTATSAADNISATGNFATALARSGGAVVFSTTDGVHSNPFQAEYQQTPTLLANGATNILGINATNQPTTALTATLNSLTSGTFTKPATITFSWGSGTGTINLNGTSNSDSGNSRTVGCGSTCYIGSTSGSGNFWNGHIASIAVYPSQITPTVAPSAVSSVDFSVPSLSGFTPSSSNGDLPYSTVGIDGNTYIGSDDVNNTNGSSTPANQVLRELQTSGGGTWVPSTAPGKMVLVNFFNTTTQCTGANGTNACFYGSDGALDANNANWKEEGAAAILGSLYYTTSKNIYSANASGCTTWFSTWTCDAALQYIVTGTLIRSVTTDSSGWPLTTSTTWTSTDTSNSNVGFPTTSAMLTPNCPGSTCQMMFNLYNGATNVSNYFAAPTFIQYGADYNPASTYGAGSTPWCAGGVAGGCPAGAGTYAYAYSNDGSYYAGNSIQLGRVSLANLPNLHGGDWQWWNSGGAGCSGVITDNNCWTSAIQNTTPVAGTSTLQAQPVYNSKLGQPSVTCMPLTGRCIMLTQYYPSVYYSDTAIGSGGINTGWTTWEIRETSINTPQGPWTLVGTKHWAKLCNGGAGDPYGTIGARCGSSQGTWGGTSTFGIGFYSPSLISAANGSSTDGGLTGAVLTAGNFFYTGTFYATTYMADRYNY